MIKYIIPIMLYFFIPKLSAQTPSDSIKKNSVYVEFLGSSPYLYNLSYDRILLSEGKTILSAALGIQNFFHIQEDNPLNSRFSMTPQVNLLFGAKHYLEVGIGAHFLSLQDVAIPFRLGYRFQKDEGGLFFKAALTPLFLPEPGFFGKQFLPWAGLSIGYTL